MFELRSFYVCLHTCIMGIFTVEIKLKMPSISLSSYIKIQSCYLPVICKGLNHIQYVHCFSTSCSSRSMSACSGNGGDEGVEGCKSSSMTEWRLESNSDFDSDPTPRITFLPTLCPAWLSWITWKYSMSQYGS